MFDTKKEKYAYVQGLKAGGRGKKPYPRKSRGQPSKQSRTPATYRDVDIPTVSRKKRRQYTDDFERTSTGRIKGSYTVDGFFEPD